jgi:hypothetical protein
MKCPKCGAETNDEGKYCEYCQAVVNENGKDYSFNGTGECFEVFEILKIGRCMASGKALQLLKVGDTLYFGNRPFVITNMQVGRNIANIANPGDNVGLLFDNLDKKDLKSGDKLVFRKE